MFSSRLLVCGLLFAAPAVGATASEIIVVDPGHGGSPDYPPLLMLFCVSEKRLVSFFR
jgi:hypothetical protein